APLLFLIAGFSVIQINTIKAKEVERRLAMVADDLYVGKYEVTNKEFQAFLSYLSSNGHSEQAVSFQTDSATWFSHPDGAKLAEHYHRHKGFSDYPIVGISYEAAQAYCEWLTRQYLADNKRKFKNVLFRLPTEKEWQEAAWAGNKQNRYPWGNYLVRRTGEYMAVYRKISDQRITYDSSTQSYRVVISQEEVE